MRLKSALIFALFISLALISQSTHARVQNADRVQNTPAMTVAINEIRTDQPSTDVDEYFELFAPGGTSLNNYTYVVIGDGSGGSGMIETAVSLSGQTVPADGYFVAAESTYTLGNADFTTSMTFENNDNVTHLLVTGFTGATNQDLDANDDGTLDTTPWATIEDCVALVETVGSGDQVYCSTQVGPNGTFAPGHVYLASNGTGWQIGGFTSGNDDTPGAVNGTATGTNNCNTIPEIQGNGTSSPCLGFQSNIVGCITGVSDDGFYMQDTAGDGDPTTSDGIYVYINSSWTNPNNWAIGDQVSVSGTIVEFYDTTEFQFGSSITVTGSCTVPAPVPVPMLINPNVDPVTVYEQYEGMRVQMTFNGWVTGPTKRFASDFIAGDPEIAFVDFASSIPNYDRVFETDYPGYQGINYISGALNQNLPDLDFGDEISGINITGVLGYNFSKYQLMIDSPAALSTIDNPDVTSTIIPADTAIGEFDICWYNVENLFDNIDNGVGDWGDWAPGYPTSGSAAGASIYNIRLTALSNSIVSKMDSCMVIGLQEVEGQAQVYNAFASALSAADSAHSWTAGFIPSGDVRNITQGFLWRNDVTILGSVTGVTSVPDGTVDFRRTPAKATFRFNSGTAHQEDITLYSVHFKSKRSSSSCTQLDCTDVREAEARDMRDIMAQHNAAGDLAIAGGDFNDVMGSSPIGILDASSAIANLFYDLPATEWWTFIFSGESEVLDHAYATQALMNSAWIRDFSAIHINADFPANEHVSDHDPIRLRLTKASPLSVELESVETGLVTDSLTVVLALMSLVMVTLTLFLWRKGMKL